MAQAMPLTESIRVLRDGEDGMRKADTARRARAGRRDVRRTVLGVVWGPWGAVFCPSTVPTGGRSAPVRGKRRRSERQAFAGCGVLAAQAPDQLGRARHLGDRADALPAAPDVLPGLLRVAAEVHLAGIRFGQVVRIESRGTDGGREVVAMHAREEVAVDDVVGVALDDGLLVGLLRARLVRGDEGRADIGEVGAHGLRGQDGATRGDRARERQRAVEPLADFLDERERALDAGMAARARRHGDQAVGALLDGLVGELVVDDVVQHHAAPAMHGLVHVLARAQAGDDDRHLVLGAHLHVVLQPVVALVHDLVDGERRGGRLGMRAVPGRQRLGDLGEPFVQQFGGPGVERRHGADDAGLALRDHQLRIADDEERRADDRQRKFLEHGRQGAAHGEVSGCCRGLVGEEQWLRRGAVQKASGASAVTLAAPSTMASRWAFVRTRMCSA